MTTRLRQKFVVGNWKMHTNAFEAKRKVGSRGSRRIAHFRESVG
jgi:triosephosphate isomerase